MTVRRRLKRLVEELLDVRIYSRHPHGRDDCHDIQRSGSPITTVLDVGANDGGSAIKFAAAFPAANIHSFEPVSATFERLRENTAHLPGVHCHRLAVGAAAGEAPIYLTDHSSTNSLMRPVSVRGEELATVVALDDFTDGAAIDRVDLLKVDTEGFELAVLQGATRLLERGRIRFVLAEVGFHPGDSRHVLFEDVRALLLGHGFAVFGIYDQQLEWSGEPRLRYANACFCHLPPG